MVQKLIRKFLLFSFLLSIIFIIDVKNTRAVMVFVEDFNSYPPGYSASYGGWTGNTTQSILDTTANPLIYCSADQSVYVNGGNRAIEIWGTSNEILNRDLGSNVTGDVYISYLVQGISPGADDFVSWYLDDTIGTHSADALVTGFAPLFASPPNDYFFARVDNPAVDRASTGTVPGFPSASYFVVAHFALGATYYELAEIWVNPLFSDSATPQDSTVSNNSLQSTYRYIGIRSDRLVLGETTLFDELRIGTTWNDVVPQYAVDVSFINTLSAGPEASIVAPLLQVSITGSYATVQEDIVLTVTATNIDTNALDYTLNNNTITIPAGTANGALIPLDVTFNDDLIAEPDEDVQFTLSGSLPCGVSLGSATHTATIQNDDSTISLNAATATISEAGGSYSLILTLNGTVTVDTDVTISINGLSTLGLGEYSLTPLVVTFPAGSTAGTTRAVIINSIDDSLMESSELLTLDFAVTSGTVTMATGSTQFTLIVQDNDIAGGGNTVILQSGASGSEYISKSVDKPLAAIGDVVTYTIVARNPKDIPLTQVVIYDVFDERLDNIRLVSTTHGVSEFDNQTLTVSGFSLQPDEEITIVVDAQVAALAAGDVIPNAAVLESPDASIHVSNLVLIGDNPLGNNGDGATVFVLPGQLPASGSAPPWRRWLLPALIVITALGSGCGYIMIRRESASS